MLRTDGDPGPVLAPRDTLNAERRPGARGSHMTCTGFFLSSGCFGFAVSSLFGAGRPFFVPSPAIRFPERAEGVEGPKR
jgi:hypothetical protein